MTPTLNRKLNLVIEVEQGDKTLFVHSTPIAREVFDTFFLVIAKTFAEIYEQGLGIKAGPKVAAKLLQKVATELGNWDSTDANAVTVKNGLVAEIKRLTNVFVPADKGWTLLPLEDAVRDGVIDVEDADDIENMLVFFTVISLMHKKGVREVILGGALTMWGGRLESSSCTEYRDSLPTSMPAGATTPAKA